MLDFRIKEILRIMRELQDCANKHPLEPLDMSSAKVGLEMSETVSAQQEEVVTTPWMKNLLVSFGDLKKGPDGKTERLTIDRAGKTEAEKFLSRVVKACLLKYNGQERTEYNQKLSVLDPDHYNVDCWLQNKFGDYMWDIKAGQAKQRAEFMAMYETEAKLNFTDVYRLIEKDPIAQKACLVLLEVIPEVRADREIHNISSPFMGKDSNVGYPYFRNDRKKVSKENPETWGRYTIQEAEKLTNNMNYPWKAWKYNVDVGWARNQRGKGRAIIAKSRILNLVVNSLEANEVAKMKMMPLFVGLNDDQTQKDRMIKQAEFCIANNCSCANYDQDGYDHHIGEGFVCLMAALRKIKANGHLARELCDLRYAAAQKSWCIDGANHKIKRIFGRTTSGWIDTMGQNSWLTVWLVLYCLMSIFPNYTNVIWYKLAESIFSLGDDMLFAYLNGEPEFGAKFSKIMAKLGFEVKPEKYAFGSFFLQYRLIKKDGKYIMSYPWTRVLRSMLSKENKKGLGPVGWAIAGWQQLSKLAENEEALRIVLNLILPLDTDGLFLNKDINWIKNEIAREDQAAKSKDDNARTTAEILYQGNPQQEGQFTEDGRSLNYGFLGDLQSKLKAAVIPHFYESLGFKTPKIS